MTITDSRAAEGVPTPEVVAPRGSNSHPAIAQPSPASHMPGGDQLAGGHNVVDAPRRTAAGNQHTDRHVARDAHCTAAVGANSRSAASVALPIAQPPSGAQLTDRRGRRDAHGCNAVGDNSGQGQAAVERPTPVHDSLLDPALAFAADILDDIERVRVANANRLQILTRTAEDKDGEVRGFGLDESHPDVARLAAMVELLKRLDKDATKHLEKVMRRHPLHSWAKGQKGVGDKQVARLLAAIGDPYINGSTGLPRTVSALWKYCGLHVLPGHASLDDHGGGAGDGGDPGRTQIDDQTVHAGVAPKRQRGIQSNWSTRGKTRAMLIADSCIRQKHDPCTAGDFEGSWLAVHYECTCSPYRKVYDERRMHTAVTHPEWTAGHSANDAKRFVAKRILRDLWRAARAHHNPGGAA